MSPKTVGQAAAEVRIYGARRGAPAKAPVWKIVLTRRSKRWHSASARTRASAIFGRSWRLDGRGKPNIENSPIVLMPRRLSQRSVKDCILSNGQVRFGIDSMSTTSYYVERRRSSMCTSPPIVGATSPSPRMRCPCDNCKKLVESVLALVEDPYTLRVRAPAAHM